MYHMIHALFYFTTSPLAVNCFLLQNKRVYKSSHFFQYLTTILSSPSPTSALSTSSPRSSSSPREGNHVQRRWNLTPHLLPSCVFLLSGRFRLDGTTGTGILSGLRLLHGTSRHWSRSVLLQSTFNHVTQSGWCHHLRISLTEAAFSIVITPPSNQPPSPTKKEKNNNICVL